MEKGGDNLCTGERDAGTMIDGKDKLESTIIVLPDKCTNNEVLK